MEDLNSFLIEAAFVSIDLQADITDPDEPRRYADDEFILRRLAEQGKTVHDMHAAWDFTIDVVLPNACKIADACRALELPMIFVHWGFRLHDGTDLDPNVVEEFRARFGSDVKNWLHFVGGPTGKPASQFKVRNGEYVLAKTAQDAFVSSDLEHLLRNLGVRNIIFVGGHTGACLGKTCQSARERGFKALLIEDAANEHVQSCRIKNLEAFGYDSCITTEAFLSLAQEFLNERKSSNK